MSLVSQQKSAKKQTQSKGSLVNCSTQEDQRPQSCVCQVQFWFFGQRGIYCQQIEGVVYPPQLWQARSRLPDTKTPAHVGTCRRSSPTNLYVIRWRTGSQHSDHMTHSARLLYCLIVILMHATQWYIVLSHDTQCNTIVLSDSDTDGRHTHVTYCTVTWHTVQRYCTVW